MKGRFMECSNPFEVTFAVPEGIIGILRLDLGGEEVTVVVDNRFTEGTSGEIAIREGCGCFFQRPWNLVQPLR